MRIRAYRRRKPWNMELATKMIINRTRSRTIRSSVIKFSNEKRECEILLTTVIENVV